MHGVIKCPRCGQQTKYSPENLYRPFCSERCQLIDLGKWATEQFAIPTEDSSDTIGPDNDIDHLKSKDKDEK